MAAVVARKALVNTSCLKEHRIATAGSTNNSTNGFMLSMQQLLRHCLHCFRPGRQQLQRVPGMPLFTQMPDPTLHNPTAPHPSTLSHTLTVTGSSDSCARALTSLARERGLRSITAPRPLRVASADQKKGTQQ